MYYPLEWIVWLGIQVWRLIGKKESFLKGVKYPPSFEGVLDTIILHSRGLEAFKGRGKGDIESFRKSIHYNKELLNTYE